MLASARAVLETPADELPEWWPELARARAGPGWPSRRSTAVRATGSPSSRSCSSGPAPRCLPGPLLPTAIVATALDRWGDGGRRHRVAGVGRCRRLRRRSAFAGAADGDDVVVSGSAPLVVERSGRRRPAAAGGGGRCPHLVPRRPGRRRGAGADELRPDPTGGRGGGRRRPRASRAAPAPDAAVDELAGVLAGGRGAGASPSGASTPRRSTPGPAGSSVGRSASSRRSSTAAPTCLPPSRPPAPRCGTPPASSTAATGPAWPSPRPARSHPTPASPCAKDCIQVLGGIGYTWEHDAHLFLKRSTAVRHLLPAPSVVRAEMAAQAASGRAAVARRSSCPTGAEDVRERVKAFVADLVARPKAEWNRILADSGYLVPHWPKPWGLDASPIEQLVIDEELRAREGPAAPPAGGGLGAARPSSATASPDQQERWIPPTMRGEIALVPDVQRARGRAATWPGSRTRATKVDGGWSITGQKVWTTHGHGGRLGASASPAPIPTRRSTPASAASWSTWRRRASTSGRSAS